jgi:hypothetical protein
VGHGGHDFAPAPGGQIGKYKVNDGPPDVGKRVAVEEKKRRAAMALPEERYGFGKGFDEGLSLPPLCFKRCVAL